MASSYRRYVPYFFDGIFVSVLIFLFLSIVRDAKILLKAEAWDLNTRVIGSYFLAQGKDPYMVYEDSAYVYRPDITDASKNRLTVTPSVLFLQIPFVLLDERSQRIVWGVCQWIMLFLTAYIFSTVTFSKVKKKLILILMSLLSISLVWRWNMQVGQIYILYAFLAALAYKAYSSSLLNKGFVSGVILGFLSSLRFTFAPVWFAMFFLRKRDVFLGGMVGFFSGILLPMVFKMDVWVLYFRSMLWYTGLHNYYYDKFKSFESTGWWEMLRHFNAFSETDSSLHRVLRFVFSLEFSTFLCITLMGTTFALSVLLLRRRTYPYPYLFLCLFLIVFIMEILLPAPRLSYSDVVLIAPISLIVLQSGVKEFLKSKINLLLIPAIFMFENGVFVATYFFILYLLLMIVFVVNKKVKSR